MANKRGRPSRYQKEYCQQLIDHMSQGLSFDTFAGRISVNPDTLYEWLKHHVDFSEAKKIGTAKRNYLVENMYVSAAMGKKVYDSDGKVLDLKPNPAMMIYWTKNTLGWSDKVEQSFDETTAAVFQLKYKIDE